MEIDEHGAARVIFAITIQAVKDHRAGDAEATQWLEDHALGWLSVTGMDYDETDIARALASSIPLWRMGKDAV